MGSEVRRGLLAVAGVCAVVSAACVAIPMYVIRPFRPQGAGELALALGVRRAGPWVAGLCAVIAVAVVAWGWKRIPRVGLRMAAVGLCAVALAGACLAQVNIFEKMFHPYGSPEFVSADAVQVDGDDKVLAVTIGGEGRAYPIRTMGYHHIVNDTVGGVPIAVTYCTLCHTGLVWNRVVDGRTLRFRLAGINNGNALIRDEETSTIWQQSTGEGIFGPLKGRHLEVLRSDELTFALWKREQPHGMVLKPATQYVAEYDPKDWEKHVEGTRVVVDTGKSGIAGHQLMLGVTAEGQSKAYPVTAIVAAGLIEDRVGATPVIVVLGPDGASMRVFEAKGRTFAKGMGDTVMQDAETGSGWNFQGCAVDGAAAGVCLREMESHKDYWFDWMNHHPETLVYKS